MRALSINALCELTGVRAGTIRAWETRYNVLNPIRDKKNNRRLYSYEDVEKIRAIQNLLENGLTIGRVAKLTKEELHLLIQEIKPAPPPIENIKNLNHSMESIEVGLRHLQQFDLIELNQMLTQLRLNNSLEDFINDFIVPFFFHIGQLVEVNKISIAHEHAFSAILRNHLLDILSTIPEVRRNAPALALATPENNHHEFGILISNIICRSQGINTFYFGVNMPVEPLLSAMQSLKVNTLILGNTPVPEEFLTYSNFEFIKKIDQLTNNSMHLLLGGGQPFKGKCKNINLIYCKDFNRLKSELNKWSTR